MKITEVIEQSEQSLFEAIDRSNDSDISTADLVNVIKSTRGQFSESFTGNEMIARLQAAIGQHG